MSRQSWDEDLCTTIRHRKVTINKRKKNNNFELHFKLINKYFFLHFHQQDKPKLTLFNLLYINRTDHRGEIWLDILLSFYCRLKELKKDRRTEDSCELSGHSWTQKTTRPGWRHESLSRDPRQEVVRDHVTSEHVRKYKFSSTTTLTQSSSPNYPRVFALAVDTVMWPRWRNSVGPPLFT